MNYKKYSIVFKYKDRYSHGKWNTQMCDVLASTESEAIEQCKKFYGLGVDCEYEITSISSK